MGTTETRERFWCIYLLGGTTWLMLGLWMLFCVLKVADDAELERDAVLRAFQAVKGWFPWVWVAWGALAWTGLRYAVPRLGLDEEEP